MSGSSASPRSRQTKPRRAGATANTSPPARHLPGRAWRGSTRRSRCRWRSASPRCANATTTSRPWREQAVELVLGLGRGRAPRARDAARRTRTAGPAGTGRARSRRRASSSSSPSSAQTSRTSSGCQTKSGGRSSGSTRSSGTGFRGRGSLVVVERRLDQLAAPLAGGVDRRAVDLAQRPLRERRERADALDLVAEELDPQRLAAGRREDVDEPAADGELAALLDPLDALVAGERELLGEQVDPRLVAARDRDRRRARPGRRHPLGERDAPTRRRGRRAASTSSARARSPTRCGGGSSPDSQRDAAGREERDALVAEEPAGRLGEVARVGVVGQQHAERPAELARTARRRAAAAQAPTRAPAPAARPRRRAGARRRGAGRRANGATGGP